MSPPTDPAPRSPSGRSLPAPGRGAGKTHAYARRDYLCLDCIVPGGCHPSSVLCLWRADRRRRIDRDQLDALDDPPELQLSRSQRDCYELLAAVRDLGGLGQVTASIIGRAMRSDERSVAGRLRRLAALGLVAYDFGHVVLTAAGRRLLDTLQAYAVNLRPGPRLLIRARGRYRVEILPPAPVPRRP